MWVMGNESETRRRRAEKASVKARVRAKGGPGVASFQAVRKRDLARLAAGTTPVLVEAPESRNRMRSTSADWVCGARDSV